jgi:hypothetical protein
LQRKRGWRSCIRITKKLSGRRLRNSFNCRSRLKDRRYSSMILSWRDIYLSSNRICKFWNRFSRRIGSKPFHTRNRNR